MTYSLPQVAGRSGASAVHPGYGFLSENAGFASACEERGIAFVGPPAAAIQAMGDKSEAKGLMSKANVPVVPGYHGEDQAEHRLQVCGAGSVRQQRCGMTASIHQDSWFPAGLLTLASPLPCRSALVCPLLRPPQEEAGRVGYPLLVKAVMGGGGKGMKLAQAPHQFLVRACCFVALARSFAACCFVALPACGMKACLRAINKHCRPPACPTPCPALPLPALAGCTSFCQARGAGRVWGRPGAAGAFHHPPPTH